MHAALTGGGESVLLEGGEQLAATEVGATGQEFAGDRRGALEVGIGELELAVPPGRGPDDALGRELQHPPEVFRGHEMQGSAHRPGAHDGTGCLRGLHVIPSRPARAQPDGPETARVVLRLKGEQVSHHLGGAR